eukprot:GEMP01039445.1.p1 GENE.GEMP01039445.1~~GEMP01039445.1.p1  ORF type:complete len:389 (+),score=62.55 GEMP01039445.1:26-1192(+)
MIHNIPERYRGDVDHYYDGLLHELKKVKLKPGEATTLVPLPAYIFTTPSPAFTEELTGYRTLLAATLILFSMGLFMLPRICLRSRILSRIFAPYMRYYCVIIFLTNVCIIVYVLAVTHMRLSVIFMDVLWVFEAIIDCTRKIVTDAFVIVAVLLVYWFRARLMTLIGFEQQLIRADWKDIATCFSLSRFEVIELVIWKVEDLPPSWGNSRTVFCQVLHGYNEAMHTRPIDIGRGGVDFAPKVVLQLNYDSEDDQTKLSIIIRKQEIISSAVASNLAPVTGAITGAVASLVLPFGIGVSALAGGAVGAGAASNLGQEISRLDLSSAMINRIISASGDPRLPPQRTQQEMTVIDPRKTQPWNDPDQFQVSHLIPQGRIWFRIQALSASEV